MQGISTSPGSIARCPFFHGRNPAEQNPSTPEVSNEMKADSVSLSPFEPANADPLTKTCVTSAAKATFGALPGFTKAGCPHAA